MTTTLSEGVKVPDVGSVNWAGDLEVNWNLLNGALANLSGNVKLDRDNTWTGEQSFTLPIVGSITGTASKAIADEDGTSIKTGYVNVAGNQTVTGDKSFTGSNTFNNILPNATNTYSLGSSSYQWSSVYAQTYYYNGTAWGLDQANTWTGNNTFKSANSSFGLQSTTAEVGSTTTSSNWMYWLDKNGYQDAYISRDFWSDGGDTLRISISGKRDNGAPSTSGTAVECGIRLDISTNGSKSVSPFANGDTDLGTPTNQWSSVYAQSYYYKSFTLEIGVQPAGNNTATTFWLDKNNNNLGYTRFVEYANGIQTYEIYVRNLVSNGALNPNGSQIAGGLQLALFPSTATSSVVANTTNVIPGTTNAIDLGTPTNKWKSLNGVNPGALSLPDSANAVNIDITNWDKRATNNVIGSITASMDGWINVQIQRDVDFAVWIIGTYRQLFRACIQGNGKYLVMLMLPVTKNATVTLYTLPLDALESDLVFGVYRFYPCLGNV